nr:efflux RND transporter periplasmic adaptor subunit [Halochromatium glycolicum]
MLTVLVVVALGWWNRSALLALVQDGPPADRGRPPPLVEVAPVEQREIEARLQATGTLKPDETVTITARSRGRVDAVLFDEGDPVTRHQALVLLERRRDQARVKEAAAQVAQTARELARLEALADDSFVSETELEQARAGASAARAELRISSEDLADRIIDAPFEGLIGRRQVSPGALLEPGTPVASLSRIQPLDLLLDVPGTELPRIQTGRSVVATTPAYPQRTFHGRITFVAPEVAEDTRTLALEATFANADQRLQPGMFMTAELITSRREVLQVPEAAVIAEGPSKHLFVVEQEAASRDSAESSPTKPEQNEAEPPPEPRKQDSAAAVSRARPDTAENASASAGAGAGAGAGEQDGAGTKSREGSAGRPPNSSARVERRAVQTGIRRGGWVEITSGVSAGEQVVVSGLQGLRDAMRVRIADDQNAPGEQSASSPGIADDEAGSSGSAGPADEHKSGADRLDGKRPDGEKR